MPTRRKVQDIPETIPAPPEVRRRSSGARRWFIRLLVVFIIIFLLWTWVSSIFKEKIPKVPAGSVLMMSNYGPIVEYNRNRLPVPFMYTKFETLLDMVYSLKKAAVDERLRGVVFKFGNFDIGLAQAKELRDTIVEYRKSGKKIYSYAETYSTVDYYIASACDKVFLMPQGMLDLRGIAVSRMYYKGLLDKLGIKAEFVRIENYKTAPTVYTEYEMTPYDREQREALLDAAYNEIVGAVAESRKTQRSEIFERIDSGVQTGTSAKEMRLIDDVLYLDQVVNLFKVKGEKGQETVWDSEYRRIPAEDIGLNKGPVIALVYATGGIVDGVDSYDFQSGETMGCDTLIGQLREARLNRDVKAVVFRIDSPGGSGTASEAILRGIQELKETGKPVVVSMGNVAGSGGYYIACQADKIVAEPVTITGSIGIYAGKFDLSGFYKKLGLNKQVLKRGKFSDIFTETRPATEEEKRLIYNLIADFYKGFLERVARGRAKSPDEIDQIGRGRVWSGADALKVGLVDELGGMDKAIEIAKRLAKIKPEQQVRIILYPKRKSIMDILFGGEGDETIRTAEQAFFPRLLPDELREAYSLLRLIEGAENYKIFAMMPYYIEIK